LFNRTTIGQQSDNNRTTAIGEAGERYDWRVGKHELNRRLLGE